MRTWLCVVLLGMVLPMVWGDVKVTNVEVKPRWPWNGKVDITYSIECNELNEDGTPKDVYLFFTGHDKDLDRDVPMRSLSGDGASGAVKAGGPYTVTWDAAKDEPNIHSSSFSVTIQAMAGLPPYLVVDLQTWAVRYSPTGPDLSNDVCRTTELWLRRIDPGTFTMGSPSNELGRNSDEPQHQVTLTQMYYMGVFECTQKQWQLVMGTTPSNWKGDTRPVEYVSYNDIRGSSPLWPASGHTVASSSFMGKLQEKTGRVFDLPTEAQWEYACRAGTTTALNSGKNLTGTSSCSNMAEVGRYYYNKSDGKGGYSQHTKVGSYLPNAWGLYDMHGNVWEWCLDWYGSYGTIAVTDPVGAASGSYRVLRGGYWGHGAQPCRSAYRDYSGAPSCRYDGHGFRVGCLPPVR